MDEVKDRTWEISKVLSTNVMAVSRKGESKTIGLWKNANLKYHRATYHESGQLCRAGSRVLRATPHEHSPESQPRAEEKERKLHGALGGPTRTDPKWVMAKKWVCNSTSLRTPSRQVSDLGISYCAKLVLLTFSNVRKSYHPIQTLGRQETMENIPELNIVITQTPKLNKL